MSISKNYVFNLLFQLTTFLFPVVMIPYATRILGPQSLGIFSYSNSIVQYFLAFAAFGISIYGQREIASLRADSTKRSQLFYEIFLLNLLCSLSVTVLFFGFLFIIGKYFIFFLIQSSLILLSSLDISWFYLGLERFQTNLYRNLIAKVLSLVLLFTLVKKESDLWIYVLLYALSIIVGNIYLWVGIKKYLHPVAFSQLKVFHHFKKSFRLFIIILLGVIGLNLSKTIIGSIVSLSELGKFDIAYKIITILLLFSTSVGSVIMPRIAYLHSIKDSQSIDDHLRKSFSLSSFISLGLMFGLIGMAKNLITLYLGDKFEGTYYFVYLLSPMIVINTISNILAVQYMIPTQQERKYFISLLTGTIVGALSLVLLTTRFSTAGTCLAILIGEIVILSAHLLQIRTQLKMTSLFREVLPNLASGLIMVTVIILINILSINPILKLSIQAFIGTIIFVSMSLLLGNDTLLIILRRFWINISERI